MGKMGADNEKKKFYCPDIVPSLRECEKILKDFIPFVKAHRVMPSRAQCVAYKLLDKYIEFCLGLIPVFTLRAAGLSKEAHDKYYEFILEFGKYEPLILPYYDQWIVGASYRNALSKFDPTSPF